MNSAKIWLRWVREGSAYTITKSRREAVKHERLRVVALFAGYAAGIVEEERKERHQDPYRRFVDYGYGKILKKEYGLVGIDDFCLSLLESAYNERGQYPTLQRFLYYACDVIVALFCYAKAQCTAERDMFRNMIQMHMQSLHSPNAGAIARRAFREIETELRKEATL